MSDTAVLSSSRAPAEVVSTTPRTQPSERFIALDAFRGLAIVLMIFVNWAGNYSLPTQFGHSEWDGITLADTVFPAFLVAVGTSIPFSTRTGWRRVVGRSIMLYLIGCALVSFRYEQPFALTVGVLQLTAVAYLGAWLVTRLPRPAQLPLVAALLAGTSLAALYAGPDGVAPGSFEPGTSLAEWFDAQLGMEPHPENPHAWIPAIGSVFIGVVAGRISREKAGGERVRALAGWGLGLMVVGLLVSLVIPVNKYLWSTSFLLITGAIAVLVLTILTLAVPAGSRGWWVMPLVLVGGNAIVIYAVSETLVARAHDEWLWPRWEPIVTERYGELAAGAAFPLAAVLACVLLAAVLKLLNIRIRV